METEIRTRKSPLMQTMIDAVRDVLGPYEDEILIRTIGYCRTPAAAVKRCSAVLDILPAVRPISAEENERMKDADAELAAMTDEELAVLQVASDVLAGTKDATELTAALLPNGVEAEFARMEAEGRIVVHDGLQLTASLPEGKPRRRKIDGVLVAYSQFCHCAKPKLDDANVCRCGTQWIQQ